MAPPCGDVTAYVIDTGIRITHGDFGGRARHGFDFVDNDPVADDCSGHGTHVAGTIGGAAHGVAKGVRLVAVRVLNCAGSGTLAAVIAGVNWVTANGDQPGVANMSLGGAPSTALDSAVRNSLGSGIQYTIAAGNSDADACGFSPARLPEAITVGATDANDNRALFNPTSASNWGPCLDLFAPGRDITSAWITSDTAVNTISGTSMAAPHVAGVAALYLQHHPAANWQQVRNAIVGNATPGVVGIPGPGSPTGLLFSGFAQLAVGTEVPLLGDFDADYNGDGVTEIAVWRPSDGTWYLRGIGTVGYGQLGDIPVPGYYNGDGVTEIAVWRPSDGTWYLRGIGTIGYGQLGDIPVP